VLVEQRLESQDLACRNAGVENAFQLAPKCSLALASRFARLGKSERLHIASRHSPERREVPWQHHRNHCDWICPGRGHQLRASRGDAEKNHCVRVGIHGTAGKLDCSIAGVSERAQEIREECLIIVRLSDNGSRRRIDFVQQPAQCRRAGRRRDSQVLYRDRLGILDNLSLVDAPSPAKVTLDESVYTRVGSFRHNDARSFLRNLRHHKLESSRCFRIIFEQIVHPGRHDCADGLHFQMASANQLGEVSRGTRNGMNRTALHEPCRPAGRCHGEKLDAAESGESEDGLRHCYGSLGVRRHDYQLDPA
jgi:hypothetical protein